VGSVLEAVPQGSRVAVVRLRSLGDCVLTTPALQVLKEWRPDLRLGVVVEDRFRGIFEGNPVLDTLLAPAAGNLRAWNPALCLNLHGGTRSALLTATSGARWRVGFRHFRHQLLYNVRIPRAQEILGVERTVHTAEHLASAMFYIGVPIRDIPRARLVASGAKTIEGDYAVIHAAAASPLKCWRTDGFLAVAQHLKEHGLEPVFTAAAADDLAPYANYRRLQGAPLAKVKDLLARASLFFGNDSGPAHMAAAFGVPSVVLFGASNPAIWSPWRTPAEVLSSPSGIASIEVSQVLEALARLRVCV
jgi:ADP-heptose:LPS heptosyltransferase